jgi:uncharacterized protein YecT (DUF1311 family)
MLTNKVLAQSETDTTSYPIDKQCTECLAKATEKTSDMMNCFAIARDSWDKEVEHYYGLLMNQLDSQQKGNLKSSQEQWLKYKEKEFQLSNSIYYAADQGHERRIDACARQAEIVRDRAVDLKEYYELYLDK